MTSPVAVSVAADDYEDQLGRFVIPVKSGIRFAPKVDWSPAFTGIMRTSRTEV